MSNNDMRVRIIASDEADAVIDKFNKRLSDTEKPAKRMAQAVNRASKATKGIGRAAAGDGMGVVSTGLHSIKREAEAAFQGVGRLSAGLGSLTELGGLGGAGIAGAALGIADLVKHWSDVGMVTSNAAANIGVTTGELYRYQRAAALAGVSGDAVTSSLSGLNTTVWQATKGLNPNAANMLNLLKVHAAGAHGAMLPLAQILPQIADSIDRLPTPQGQIAAVSGLGMSPDMLPFLRQGGAKIQAQMDQLNKQGVGNNFDGANDAYADFQKVETAADNAANALAQKFSPQIDAATTALTKWINGLPGMSSDWDSGLKSLQDAWDGNGKGTFWQDLTAPVDSPSAAAGQVLLAGADAAGQAGKLWDEYSGLWNNSFGPQSVANAKAVKVQQAAVRDQGVQYFEGQGWKKPQAAAILGNAEQESSFDPNKDSVDPRTGIHHRGLFQWDPARWAQLTTMFKTQTPSAAQQFQFAQWELSNTQANAAAALRNSPNAGAGAIAFNRTFERSGDAPYLEMRRGSYAQYIAGLPDAPAPSAPVQIAAAPALQPKGAPAGLPADVEAALSGLRGAQPVNGKVTVDVNHNNAPPGAQASVSASGSGVALGGLRISRAMHGDYV